MAIPALGLFAVTATGVVAPWMVYLARLRAAARVNAVDNPTRQSFVIEMVGPDRVVNAVSLNSVIVQAARIVGPALAGMLIADRRRRPLLRAQRAHLRGDDLRPLADGPGAAARRAGRRRASRARSAPACATSARTPELAVPLALMALVGTLGFNFQVVLPLLAKFSFDGGADDLRGAGLGDGGRLDRRRPRQRRPRPHRPAPDRRRRARLRRPRPARRGDAEPGPRDPGARRCSAPPRSPSRRRSTRPCSSPSRPRCEAG